MRHINRIFAEAAALLTLSCTAACGKQDVTSSDTNSLPSTTQSSEDTLLDLKNLPSITLTSEDLHEGVWDTDITNTEKGTNRSPQLSWEPVEGAACYAVYMVDTTVTYWLHWKSGNVAETKLSAGWAQKNEYVGPYPPSGTHNYEIRVYALKEAVTESTSTFDSSNAGFDKMVAALDQNSSGSGNVIAYGTLTGSYTRS